MSLIIVSNYDMSPYAIVPEDKAEERIKLAMDTCMSQVELYRENIRKYPERDLYWQKQMDHSIDVYRAGFAAMPPEGYARMQGVRLRA